MNRLFDTFFQGRGLGAAAANGSRRWIPPMDLAETDGSTQARSRPSSSGASSR
ncbi:MAG TPA: hypothetical protein VF729_10075 [Solirubrobacterales bacterium]